MSSTPTVSVIMPTYNQAWFLRHALDSIAAQTYRDFELIVSIDGCEASRVASAEWCGANKGCLAHTAMMAYSTDNRGTAEAINHGVTAARGRYLTWVSSDNLMHPEWLERLVAVLRYGPVVDHLTGRRAGGPTGCAYAGFWWVPTPRESMSRAAAELTGSQWSVAGEWQQSGHARYLHVPYAAGRQIQTEDCYLGPAHLVRREVWAAHRGRISHDLDAFLRIEEACWERGFPIVGVAEPLCCYFAHGERATVTRRAEYDAPHWLAEARKRRGIE